MQYKSSSFGPIPITDTRGDNWQKAPVLNKCPSGRPSFLRSVLKMILPLLPLNPTPSNWQAILSFLPVFMSLPLTFFGFPFVPPPASILRQTDPGSRQSKSRGEGSLIKARPFSEVEVADPFFVLLFHTLKDNVVCVKTEGLRPFWTERILRC